MRFRIELCAILLPVLTTGCALYRSDADGTSGSRQSPSADPARLADTPDLPVRQVVRMEPLVITRPASETRVRQHVWEKLCESGLMSPDTRRRLNENGFRVGVSGASVPWALDSLIRENGHPANRRPLGAGSEDSHLYFSASGGPTAGIAVLEGSESLVQIRRASGAEIPSDAEVRGLRGLTDSDTIRCVFRIRTVESGNGWVLLQFVPELRFGSQTPRYTIEEGDERLPVRQQILPLHDQQIEIRLHTGEVVVIGLEKTENWTLGRLFFLSDSLTSTNENLLVLRLTDIETVEGQRSLQVSAAKY